ncbi:hypothetical protein ACQCVE_04810 [Metabacillus sp. 113a]|uniref:hypothetical protein n=1 Tax=Metabacillus sp. 113a TaxID=3404706 RepID=UPI003CE82445
MKRIRNLLFVLLLAGALSFPVSAFAGAGQSQSQAGFFLFFSFSLHLSRTVSYSYTNHQHGEDWLGHLISWWKNYDRRGRDKGLWCQQGGGNDDGCLTSAEVWKRWDCF